MTTITEKETEGSVFKQLLQEYFKGAPKAGEVVQGTVLSISNSEVRLELGGVAVGVVRGREITSGVPADLKVGDTIEATVVDEENENGEVELSFRAAGFTRAWDRAAALMRSQEIIEVKITDANKGGLMALFGPLGGFLPVSQLSPENYPRIPGGDKAKILEHLRKFMGKTMRVKVMDAAEKDEKLIFSEKLVWEDEQKDVLGKYKVGDVIEGKISAITSFGAFMEFGENLEGLIHISELAWQRIDHPRDVVKAGDPVKAQIIQIDGSKIFLSLKRLVDDPWKIVKDRYQTGQTVRGRIIKVNPFGLFVELDPEIHGLAHISDISDEPVKDINEIASVGDQMDFEIVSIEPAAHRLGLRKVGLKPRAAAEEAEATEEEQPTVEQPVEEQPVEQPEEPAA
ncbi:MAG: S1 RNA-binding domain-containing protein [Patescibacteria group bacterium]